MERLSADRSYAIRSAKFRWFNFSAWTSFLGLLTPKEFRWYQNPIQRLAVRRRSQNRAFGCLDQVSSRGWSDHRWFDATGPTRYRQLRWSGFSFPSSSQECKLFNHRVFNPVLTANANWVQGHLVQELEVIEICACCWAFPYHALWPGYGFH